MSPRYDAVDPAVLDGSGSEICSSVASALRATYCTTA